jgi:tRNA threonylcarbamoyl adenosine modification protein YeaZ
MNQKAVILAVETSSRIGSVALAHGADLLGELTFSSSLRHSAEIFPAITELLERFSHTASDIEQVHISVGPGSFTGLRIAATAAKCVHLANSARIVTVDSLDTIAANVMDAGAKPIIQNTTEEPSVPKRLATILDAKRGQFYVAVYERFAPEETPPQAPQTEHPGYDIPAPDKSLWRKVLPDCLMDASEFMDRFAAVADPIGVLGDGLLYHQDKFTTEGTRIVDQAHWGPHAAKVHTLGCQKAQAGQFTDPLSLTPFYLRGPQVTLRKKA